jgi:predicted glycoside hydrolase/deacetylase ChbG (UPF0249 family)
MKVLIALILFSSYPFLVDGMPRQEKTLQERLGYGKNDILVIAHVDDIGMHRDETDGALSVLGYGLAKTGSVLVPAPDFPRFAEIWKRNPAMDIGIHVTFNSEWDAYRWPPVLPRREVPSLFDPEGFMWKRQPDFSAHADDGEAAREMEAQVDRVLGMGLKPTHIDPHMGSYYFSPSLFRAAVDLALMHNLVIPYAADPSAKALLAQKGLVCADTFNGFYQIDGEEGSPGTRRAAYQSWLKSLTPGVHYLYLHAAHVTGDLEKIIEMPYIRSGDLQVWTSPETKSLAEKLGIRFIGIRELQKLQAKNLGIMG